MQRIVEIFLIPLCHVSQREVSEALIFYTNENTSSNQSEDLIPKARLDETDEFEIKFRQPSSHPSLLSIWFDDW